MRNKTNNHNDAVANAVPDKTMPALRMQDVRKSFGQHEVLRGITLQVQKGEVVAILGSSGSG